MGNVLTAATVRAADVIVPVPSKVLQDSKAHVHKTYEGEPPPECPMHKPAGEKQQPPKYSSECPIDRMDEKDINPLNMVCIYICETRKKKLMILFTDWRIKIRGLFNFKMRR